MRRINKAFGTAGVMKVVFTMVYMLMCVLVSGKNRFYKKCAEIEKIEIIKPNGSLSSPSNLDCALFGVPARLFCKFSFYSQRDKKRILNWLSMMTSADDNFYMDTRAQIYLYYKNGSVDTVCLSQFHYVSVNNINAQFNNDDLFKYIDKLNDSTCVFKINPE